MSNSRAREPIRDRAASMLGVAAVHVLLAIALWWGLRVSLPLTLNSAAELATFVVDTPTSEKDPVPVRRITERHSKAASRPNLKSLATEVVVPAVPVVAKPLVIAAPRAAGGSDASSGATQVAGTGTGGGGRGNGTGDGDGGDGDLRLISGRIKDSDYPKHALQAGIGGTVGLRFVVGVNGRVTSCDVTRSSGDTELDETTCRLIMKRFRYRPSTDSAGRPIADTVEGEHSWTVYTPPPLPDDQP